MPLVTRFDTPGSLRDVPAGSPFYDDWHTYVASRLAASTPGSGGGEFYDPSEVDVNPIAERSLVWMGFPRRVLMPGRRDDRNAAFIAAEQRVVQDEYCEWRVTRNAAGKITKVTFVTEVPEYWEHLWAADRPAVVALYRALVDPAVVESDLGTATTYNRQNRWNTTDGIVHFIQSINTLDAAFGLAQGSVNSSGARDNYEHSANTGFANTSVDPRVALDIGALARKGLSITLREPIGIYIAALDVTGWTKPSGAPVGNYARVVRGVPGAALRLEYKVPAGLGFVVGDIRIGGRRTEWGGQIAEHVTCTIGGIAGMRGR